MARLILLADHRRAKPPQPSSPIFGAGIALAIMIPFWLLLALALHMLRALPW